MAGTNKKLITLLVVVPIVCALAIYGILSAGFGMLINTVDKRAEEGSISYKTLHFTDGMVMRQLTCTNGIQCFYYSDGSVYQYYENSDPVLLADGISFLDSMAATEDYLYFVFIEEGSKGVLKRIDLKTGGIITLGDSQDISQVAVFDRDVFIAETTDGTYNSQKIYLLKDGKTDSETYIELNSLLAAGEKLNDAVNYKPSDYLVKKVLGDYEIWGNYNEKSGSFQVNCIVSVEENRVIAYFGEPNSENYVYDNQKMTRFYIDQYKNTGTGDWRDIQSLKADKYPTGVHFDHIFTEGGHIVGLAQFAYNFTYNQLQKFNRGDGLFYLDPDTGESGMIYRTEDNKTRIIGYLGRQAYLLRNYKILAYDPIAKIETEIGELEPYDRYVFDWCGGKLFVFMQDDSLNVTLFKVVTP
ncbi:MAG TPA: hypothetical protein VHT96_18545 [Clostridia bacterium]|nr:hypothetical protein [Clostridia bacterium]